MERTSRRRGRHVVREDPGAPERFRLTRREVISLCVAGGLTTAVAVLAGVGELEAVTRPFSSLLNQFDGQCDPAPGTVGCEVVGTNVSGSFYSRYRQRSVGYTVGYPKGYGPGSRLPLVVFLHGFRGTHEHALAGYSPAQAVSVGSKGHPITPMALVTVDGGNGYWHPHPGDDPMGMILKELIPMMQARGLGRGRGQIATMGISMGGYGAIALAENYPDRIAAVAAISPAIFVSYEHVHYVNPGAYTSAADFNRYDAVTHADRLRRIPVRVASGLDDPFHPWVEDLARALGPTAVVEFPPGAHTGSFFYSQVAPSIEFLAGVLS